MSSILIQETGSLLLSAVPCEGLWMVIAVLAQMGAVLLSRWWWRVAGWKTLCSVLWVWLPYICWHVWQLSDDLHIPLSVSEKSSSQILSAASDPATSAMDSREFSLCKTRSSWWVLGLLPRNLLVPFGQVRSGEAQPCYFQCRSLVGGKGGRQQFVGRGGRLCTSRLPLMRHSCSKAVEGEYCGLFPENVLMAICFETRLACYISQRGAQWEGCFPASCRTGFLGHGEMEPVEVACLESRSKSGIAADRVSAQLVLCFRGTTAPSSPPSHVDCHPTNSTVIAGVPAGLIFPLVSACSILIRRHV